MGRLRRIYQLRPFYDLLDVFHVSTKHSLFFLGHAATWINCTADLKEILICLFSPFCLSRIIFKKKGDVPLKENATPAVPPDGNFGKNLRRIWKNEVNLRGKQSFNLRKIGRREPQSKRGPTKIGPSIRRSNL
jgi:hypothetical protein